VVKPATQFETITLKRIIITALAASSLAVISAFGAGCSSDESLAGGDAATSAGFATAPTFSALDAALHLDSTDESVVKAALADWDRDDTGSRRPGLLARQSEMKFVAAVAPSLDDNQLTELVNLFIARREARHAVMRERRGEDKSTKVASMREDRVDRRREHRADAARKPVTIRAAWLDAVLELNDEQAAAVEAALTAMADTRAAIRTSRKSETITREQAREQMLAARETRDKRLESILSEEQKTRLEIVKPLMPGRRHHA
jgi:hypothetical protein